MTSRLGLIGFMVVAVVASACAPMPSKAGCQLNPAMATLASQIPDQVGTCQGAQVEHVEIGQTWQPTTRGTLVYSSIDKLASFSDASQTWVLDPGGQAQTRPMEERFSFEFNGDGFPVVGQSTPTGDATCPSAPVTVLAVENFYARLVDQLGGQCVTSSAILSDPSADPHEYQPNADDVRAYQNAQLVIENGLGYDDFNDKIMRTLRQPPRVLNAGDVLGLQVGANPHVWYSATSVEQLRAAITANLKQLDPAAASYFDARADATDQTFETYRDELAQIRTEFGGVPVGSTETIFEGMAASTGLQVVSPPGFMQAVAEGNEPTARDVATFLNQIRGHQIRVLVYNTQTVTNQTEQLKAAARDNGIPTIGVSETLPEGAQTFQGWQSAELALLLQALRNNG
jgi:zinc/manganese transport system substrate-binding protein